VLPTCTSPPSPIGGGTTNPNSSLVPKTFYSSSPSGRDQVSAIGYMRLFIQEDYIHRGSADLIGTIILNVSDAAQPPGAVSR
jgi:hypothetical protein